MDTLTAEQRAAYDRLGEVLKKNAYRPVTDLKIKAASDQLKVHESIQLEAVIQPEEATMRNVIWESSDPAIASIDKFGTVQAVQPGTVTIALYSWDDTRPVASGKNATYQRNGCTDKIRLQIEP